VGPAGRFQVVGREEIFHVEILAAAPLTLASAKILAIALKLALGAMASPFKMAIAFKTAAPCIEVPSKEENDVTLSGDAPNISQVFPFKYLKIA